jgi:hypothetical protein
MVMVLEAPPIMGLVLRGPPAVHIQSSAAIVNPGQADLASNS